MAKKYLIVLKGWTRAVPQPLREFIAKKLASAFAQLDVELDFSDTDQSRDLLVTFSNEIPGWPVYGESTRASLNGDDLSGESIIYVRAMRTMRLQIGSAACEPAFAETRDGLGSMVANVTIHEIGHMLGMNSGGYDNGGHTTDPDNCMWDPTSMAGPATRVSPIFEYTVKAGDTLIGILHKYPAGTLDTCRVGPTDLGYLVVWGYKENKAKGFIGDPKKSAVRGRRANDPNWIYPGEKVALPNSNLRTQEYKHYFPGFLGDKSFTAEQIKTMKAFIAQRVAAGKG